MDAIFYKTDSIWSLVSNAEKHPRRYDKHGNLIEPESPIDGDEEATLNSGEVTRVGSREDSRDGNVNEKEKKPKSVKA